MDQRIANGSILRAVTAAVVLVLAITDVVAVVGQTLTQPNPATKAPPPPGTAKSLHAGRAKNCAIYGPGFVNVPGSDLCLKVGGYVSTEIGR